MPVLHTVAAVRIAAVRIAAVHIVAEPELLPLLVLPLLPGLELPLLPGLLLLLVLPLLPALGLLPLPALGLLPLPLLSTPPALYLPIHLTLLYTTRKPLHPPDISVPLRYHQMGMLSIPTQTDHQKSVACHIVA